MENMKDYDCPKIQDRANPTTDAVMWIGSNYPFRHNTTHHGAERKAEFIGWWAIKHSQRSCPLCKRLSMYLLFVTS